ncbi:MAG: sigma-54 dependent transcriptional regulator [Byssovorax sp.]
MPHRPERAPSDRPPEPRSAPDRLLPGLGRRPHVLVVDDEPAIRRSVARALLGKGFEVDTAEDGAAALSLLGTRPIDVILLDHGLPQAHGLAVLAQLKQQHPEVEVIVVKALGQPSTAAAARAGAFDVTDKPFDDEDRLALLIERAAEHKRLLARGRALEDRALSHERLGEWIGRSAVMAGLYRRALGAAITRAPVLILGEPGTGKELLARIIHRRSSRAEIPLTVLDCGALPEGLIEAELFGDGAPPSAEHRASEGLLARADQGTLFLDQVDALPLGAQARLAEALADPSRDLRVLAASHPDLRERIAGGRFRRDLFYRLGAVLLEPPPLRRRREDIPLLAYHFLEAEARRRDRPIRRISVEALRALRAHPWPGNVRELAAVIEHASTLARGDAILPADLPFLHADPIDHDLTEHHLAERRLALPPALLDRPYAEARDRAAIAFDRAYAEHLLRAAGGNVSEAARRAGMDRSNFRRLLKRARAHPREPDGDPSR